MAEKQHSKDCERGIEQQYLEAKLVAVEPHLREVVEKSTYHGGDNSDHRHYPIANLSLGAQTKGEKSKQRTISIACKAVEQLYRTCGTPSFEGQNE